MSQKFGLAAAFLSGRNVIVLDEPTSGLDPNARRQVRRLVDIHRGDGGTLFFSTHAIEDLPGLCDRIALLHGGTLAFSGTVDECMRCFGGRSLTDACLRGVESESAPRPRR